MGNWWIPADCGADKVKLWISLRNGRNEKRPREYKDENGCDGAERNNNRLMKYPTNCANLYALYILFEDPHLRTDLLFIQSLNRFLAVCLGKLMNNRRSKSCSLSRLMQKMCPTTKDYLDVYVFVSCLYLNPLIN